MACILASKEGSGCYIVSEGKRDKGNYSEDGGFGTSKVGDYNIWIIVFVDLKESGKVLIVEGVALLFKTRTG